MTKQTTIKTQCTEYYCDALNALPDDHPHRDEIVSLLIDQVLDDANYCISEEPVYQGGVD